MIPEAAVETAAEWLPHSGDCEVRPERDCTCWKPRVDIMRTALEAAAPHMPSSPISATEIEAVADMVKAAKADGWDEGANADHDFDGEVTTPNPYRPTP